MSKDASSDNISSGIFQVEVVHTKLIVMYRYLFASDGSLHLLRFAEKKAAQWQHASSIALAHFF